MSKYELNLNHYIIFTPTQKGIEVYEKSKDLLLQFSFTDVKKPCYETDKRPDGTLKMHVWEFMQVFGSSFTEYSQGEELPITSMLVEIHNKLVD